MAPVVKFAKAPNNYIIEVTDEKGEKSYTYRGTKFQAERYAEQIAGHPVAQSDIKEIHAPLVSEIDVSSVPAEQGRKKKGKQKKES